MEEVEHLSVVMIKNPIMKRRQVVNILSDVFSAK